MDTTILGVGKSVEPETPQEIDYSGSDGSPLIPWECLCEEHQRNKKSHRWHKSSMTIISITEIDKKHVRIHTPKGVFICRITKFDKYKVIRVVRTKKSFKPKDTPLELEDEFLPVVVAECEFLEDNWKEVLAEQNREQNPKGEEQTLRVISPEAFKAAMDKRQPKA